MIELVKMKCIPCRGGDPPASQEERGQFLPQIPEWEVDVKAGYERLMRVFSFKDYKTGLAFANDIGNIAEEKDHHPEILIKWGFVTVTWWTHVIKGLHKNDFVLAARTDQIYHRIDEGEK